MKEMERNAFITSTIHQKWENSVIFDVYCRHNVQPSAMTGGKFGVYIHLLQHHWILLR